MTRQQTRGAISEERAHDRAEHQKKLHDANNSECLQRFQRQLKEKPTESKAALPDVCYTKAALLPSDTKMDQIFVDVKRKSVLLPIFGMALPVHVLSIKSVSKTDDGNYSTLKFNFANPLDVSAGAADLPTGSCHFVKSLTFKNSDQARFAAVHKGIMELKKSALQADSTEDGAVESTGFANLQINDKCQRLNEVFIRPSFDAKRQVGILEIHNNGIRFRSVLKSSDSVDIVFSNIQHLFFQPCDNELLALIHVHLKQPVFVAKKKVMDIQFYREASESMIEETSGRRRKVRYGDEDEILQEREERRRRELLNEEFRKFAQAISDASGRSVELDIPYRELGFDGVPFRQSVLLQPTTDCLVFLSEPPYLVISLSEVEVVFLERVVFGLKNFDLVFIMKDHKLGVIPITTVPVAKLEAVKEWLEYLDLSYRSL